MRARGADHIRRLFPAVRDEAESGRFNRRAFFRGGAKATVGALGLFAQTARTETPQIRRYVRLGDTGLEISDISFGSSRLTDPDLVRHGFERGINYFDTAESYRGGRAEKAIGEALRGLRDRVVIASKHKAAAGASRVQIMRSLEASLRRLRTDYIDVYFNHAVNRLGRMQNTEWHEFTELAKRQGKIRFRAMSGHGSHLVECLDYALDHDLADVILVAHNFAQDPSFYDKLGNIFQFVALQPDLPRVINKAKNKGVGVIAMKTLMGARLNDMRSYEHGGATFSQAAFRWVLSSPDVHALVVSMTAPWEIDEYVAASGPQQVSQADLYLLARYADMNAAGYCQHGCNACEGACPEGVEIPDVLRTRMYAIDYQDMELARTDYAALGRGAAACVACAHEACLGACPNGIRIPAATRDAASRLG